MFRGGPRRLGRAAHPIPRRRPRRAWSFRTGRAIYGAAALDGRGNAYFGSLDGYLYRVDRGGKLRWRRRIGSPVFSTPALLGDLVVFGADDDHLWSVSRDDGRTRWRYRLGPCPRLPGFGADRVRCQADGSAALGADGTIYIAADAVYALTRAGKLRWRLPLRTHAHASVALAPGKALVVSTRRGEIMTVDLSGTRLWTFDRPAQCDATPVVLGDVVLAGCDDGRLYALQLSTGELRWQLTTRAPVRAAPAVGRDGTVYVGSYDGGLYAVDAEGKVLWRSSVGGAIHAAPLVDSAGAVLVGARDRALHALDRHGKPLWRVELGADVDSPPVVARRGLIYVGTDDGELVALAPGGAR